MLSYTQKHHQLMIRTIANYKIVLRMKRVCKFVNINVLWPPAKKVKRNQSTQPHLIMLGFVDHKLKRRDLWLREMDSHHRHPDYEPGTLLLSYPAMGPFKIIF